MDCGEGTHGQLCLRYASPSSRRGVLNGVGVGVVSPSLPPSVSDFVSGY